MTTPGTDRVLPDRPGWWYSYESGFQMTALVQEIEGKLRVPGELYPIETTHPGFGTWLGPVLPHDEAGRLADEVERLRSALIWSRTAIEDLIRRPMGVIPDSATEAWERINRALGEDVAMDLGAAEERRPKHSNR